MLKKDCVAVLDKDIAGLEAALSSLRWLRDSLTIELNSDGRIETVVVSTIPTGEVGEGNNGADGGGAPAAEVVQVAAVDSQGVDAGGSPILPGHRLYKE
jgi:hypothetical protein